MLLREGQWNVVRHYSGEDFGVSFNAIVEGEIIAGKSVSAVMRTSGREGGLKAWELQLFKDQERAF